MGAPSKTTNKTLNKFDDNLIQKEGFTDSYFVQLWSNKNKIPVVSRVSNFFDSITSDIYIEAFDGDDVFKNIQEVTYLMQSASYTLPDAGTLAHGLIINCKNISGGDTSMNTTSSQLIDGELTQIVSNWSNMRLIVDKTNSTFYII